MSPPPWPCTKCILRGWTTAFIDAGCIVSTPHLRPLSRRLHKGILAEVALRLHHQPQLRGPHGPRQEQCIWLRATAAASALTGCITDPHGLRKGESPMNNAKVLFFKYPDNVDTDVIIGPPPEHAGCCQRLASHCMEDIDKDFIHNVKDSDIMVGGWNFGCSSSVSTHRWPSRPPGSLSSSPRLRAHLLPPTASTSACPSWNAPGRGRHQRRRYGQREF